MYKRKIHRKLIHVHHLIACWLIVQGHMSVCWLCVLIYGTNVFLGQKFWDRKSLNRGDIYMENNYEQPFFFIYGPHCEKSAYIVFYLGPFNNQTVLLLLPSYPLTHINIHFSGGPLIISNQTGTVLFSNYLLTYINL